MKFKKDKTVNSPHIIKLKPFKIPKDMIIVVDTREQRPLFKTIPEHTGTLKIIKQKVPYGDYSILDHEFEFGIERKQISDFYGYIGKERKKTTKKMQDFRDMVQGGGWVSLVVEASEADILAGFIMSKVPGQVARGFLDSWRVRYGLHSYFNRNRNDIERYILDSMIKFYNVSREVG